MTDAYMRHLIVQDDVLDHGDESFEQHKGAKSAHRQSASAPTKAAVQIIQNIEVRAEAVQQMICDHYAKMGLRFHQTYVNFHVMGSSGSGYSYSRSQLLDASIRLPKELQEAAEQKGMPTTLKLTPKAIASIVAGRISNALNADIGAEDISWDISDGGGSGFSAHSPRLNCARVRLTING